MLARALASVSLVGAAGLVPHGQGGVVSPPGYTLVWADEFDRDGAPDPTNWTYERGFVRNQELQWYQPENARVEHGLLVIEAGASDRPTRTTNRTRPPGRETASSPNTRRPA